MLKSSVFGEPVKIPLTYYLFYPWIQLSIAVILYLPRFLWCRLEQRRMETLVQDLNDTSLQPEKQIEQRTLIAKYFITATSGVNTRYFIAFLICEILNNAVTFILFVMLSPILHTYWYGLSYFDLIKEPLLLKIMGEPNIRQVLFPVQALCDFTVIVGSSGKNSLNTTPCTIPLNSFYSITFLIIW
jgi:hypothetical protein